MSARNVWGASRSHMSGLIVHGDGQGRIVGAESHLEFSLALCLSAHPDTRDIEEQVPCESRDEAGKAGLRAAFSLIQAEQPPIRGRRDRRPGATFGLLYRWLASPHVESDHGPIRDVLRDHSPETEPSRAIARVSAKSCGATASGIISQSFTEAQCPATLFDAYAAFGRRFSVNFRWS